MGEGMKRARAAARATRKPKKSILDTPVTAKPDGLKNINPLNLSTDAKVVLGAWFGMMKPGGESALTLRLRENKPTARAQAALDELVAAKAIKVGSDRGGVRYEPLIMCFEYFQWLGKNRDAANKFALMEPIQP